MEISFSLSYKYKQHYFTMNMPRILRLRATMMSDLINLFAARTTLYSAGLASHSLVIRYSRTYRHK
jgi:hypothetical protein